jgi:transcriptional regulator with XRE-family HTH domain
VNTDESKQALAAFGQRVRWLREQRGMSPTELSERSRTSRGRRVSPQRIGRVEAGEADPHYDEMLALARGLGVTSAELVGKTL